MTSETRLIKVGERNGCDSRCFDFKGHNEISQIFVSGGDTGIKSIQFQYMENGKYVLSEQYGSRFYIHQFYTIELNHPSEYITGVYGKYSSSGNIMVITFTTNIQEYGPFGVSVTEPKPQSPDQEKSFTFNLGKSCQFGGFHGESNHSGLNFLGLYLSPKTVPTSFGSNTPLREA